MAMAFGLIHGMGFSNYLRSLLGKEESLIKPLLAFNVGLELGQLLIVLLTLVVSFLILDIFNIEGSYYTNTKDDIKICQSFRGGICQMKAGKNAGNGF